MKSPRAMQWTKLQQFQHEVETAIGMYTDGINNYYQTCLKIGAACDVLGNLEEHQESADHLRDGLNEMENHDD